VDADVNLPAVLMCGGRGTRLDADREKPLVRVGDRPMVARVLDALGAAPGVGTVHAVVSPATRTTREWLVGRAGDGELPVDLRLHDGAGEGYVADLEGVLADLSGPVLTVVADLPLLAPEAVSDALAAAGAGRDVSDAAAASDALDGAATGADAPRSVAVCVPVGLKERLGVSRDTSFEHAGRAVAPTGLNVVADGPETVHVVDDHRLAVNVNRPTDLAVARERAEGGCD
jgi:adenosylcobinamide-phosphate guanylyltransferase